MDILTPPKCRELYPAKLYFLKTSLVYNPFSFLISFKQSLMALKAAYFRLVMKWLDLVHNVIVTVQISRLDSLPCCKKVLLISHLEATYLNQTTRSYYVLLHCTFTMVLHGFTLGLTIPWLDKSVCSH